MDYSKQCWYCGKPAIVLKGNFYQCKECGATWVKLPKPQMFIDIVSETGGSDGLHKLKPKKTRGRKLPPLTAAQKADRRGYNK